MTLTYQLDDKLYLNITNRCTCACEFCIRNELGGIGDADDLRLPQDPEAFEVIEDLQRRKLSDYSEIVFCGFGEPTENLAVLLEVCGWLKENAGSIPIRLNTNGVCELSAERPVAPLLNGLIDVISISLNAPDAKRYQEVTHSMFGEKSFDAMLSFAADCKKYIPCVMFSVVDILSEEEIARCKKLAGDMEIQFRIRNKI